MEMRGHRHVPESNSDSSVVHTMTQLLEVPSDLRCGHTERYAMFATYATYAVYAMFAPPRGHTESYVWYETAQS
jgi:hypothetical protein